MNIRKCGEMEQVDLGREDIWEKLELPGWWPYGFPKALVTRYLENKIN
jgi:hypothetical protein